MKRKRDKEVREFMTEVREKNREKTEKKGLPFLLIPITFMLLEVFAFCFLRDPEKAVTAASFWPLAFGALWAMGLSCLLRVLPRGVSRVFYGILYFLFYAYAVGQTGYYNIFTEMMWLSDFSYASEGSDYISVIFQFPLLWWLSMAVLLALGILTVVRYPDFKKSIAKPVICAVLAVAAAVGAYHLPEMTFQGDGDIKFAKSDYGRSQSARAAYENMFNAHRLYELCGLYQTGVKDVYKNYIFPHTPAHASAMKAGRKEIDAYFAQRPVHEDNDMTGIFKDKNIVLVLMESMDDWLIGPHTPTISRLMEEGINFTQFYTPVYGGIRTFNTEFCTNNGFFLSSQGGLAFDYVTNDFHHSLANILRRQGYSAKTFHYNNPSFYSRGVFSLAMGYDEYVCYEDYVDMEDKESSDQLYDDKLLFDNAAINEKFFREDGEHTLNFIITRSAHLSYKYNEVLSYWGLKRYPEYRGMTGSEETDCAYLKARLVDDMYVRLLEELESHGQLEDTVIIGITDHYTYGYKNMDELYALSGVDDDLLLEKTPCFIWSADLAHQEIEKTMNTSDMLPTMLNLLGITPEVSYIGRDIFDPAYAGYAPFSDGSWFCGDVAYNAEEKKLLYLDDHPDLDPTKLDSITAEVAEFARINNLILETDYYKGK